MLAAAPSACLFVRHLKERKSRLHLAYCLLPPPRVTRTPQRPLVPGMESSDGTAFVVKVISELLTSLVQRNDQVPAPPFILSAAAA